MQRIVPVGAWRELLQPTAPVLAAAPIAVYARCMRSIVCLALALSVSIAMGACKKKSDDGASPDQASETEGKAEAGPRYQLRGVVEGYDATSNQLTLHHEAVPDFKNQEGEKVGMMSMTMSFRVAKDVDASSLKAGDKVNVEFEVQWDQAPPIEILSIAPLAADTKLDLGG